MHEFCPLCLKNGIKVKIKSFQLNFNEAVFMCAEEKCTWPVGFEDVTIINRPIGEEWSKNWDETAIKYIKKNQDVLLDFTSFTAPQIPNGQTASNCNPSSSTSVYDAGFNSISGFQNDNVLNPQKLCSAPSKPSESPVDSINNVSLKPKIVVSKTVNYSLEKFESQGYTFKKNVKNNEDHSEAQVALNNCKNNANVPTSLISDSVAIKDNGLGNNLSTKDVITRRSKVGVKVIRKKRGKQPYEKFDFSKLMKPKSTNVEKISESNVNKAAVKTENQIGELSSDVNELDKLHSNGLLNTQNLKTDGESCNIDLNNINGIVFDSNDTSQIDYNSILGLSNSSKDSGVDQDLIIKDEFDLHLDELLSVFSDEVGNTVKNPINNTEEYEWINSLFE